MSDFWRYGIYTAIGILFNMIYLFLILWLYDAIWGLAFILAFPAAIFFFIKIFVGYPLWDEILVDALRISIDNPFRRILGGYLYGVLPLIITITYELECMDSMY